MDLNDFSVSLSKYWVEFVSSNSLELLWPLFIYTIGLSLYSLLVWRFYNFLSKRDLFKLDLEKHDFSSRPRLKKAFGVLVYVIKHFFVLPVFIFFWFLVLSSMLIMMSKNQSVAEIMLVSMAIVAATRVISYFKEDMARDFAKVLPLTLIGLIVLDPYYFQSINVVERILELPNMTLNIISYLFFAQILEFTLRMLHGAKTLVFGKSEKEEKLSEHKV